MIESYYEKIAQLGRFLSRPDERGYTFACANDERIIKPANRDILQWVENKSGKKLAIVQLDPKADRTLIAQLEAAGGDALIIMRLNSWVADPNRLLNLNFARESLHALQKPILFWTTKSTLALIGNQASDLFSQRRMANVYFETPSEGFADADFLLADRFVDTHLSAEEFEELRLDFNLRRRQFDEARAARLSPARIAAEFALPYAEACSELDLHEEALSVLALYETQWQAALTPSQQRDWAMVYQRANAYEKAIAANQYILEHLQKDNSLQSYILSDLGDLYKAVGQLELAKTYYIKDLELSERLTKSNPHSEQLQRDLGVAIEKLADLEKELGQLEAARERYELRLEISERLTKSNPHSEQLQRDYSVGLYKLALMLWEAGEREKAEKYFQKDLEIARQLCALNPHRPQLWNDLTVSLEGAIRRAESNADAEKTTLLRQELQQTYRQAYDATGSDGFKEKIPTAV